MEDSASKSIERVRRADLEKAFRGGSLSSFSAAKRAGGRFLIKVWTDQQLKKFRTHQRVSHFFQKDRYKVRGDLCDCSSWTSRAQIRQKTAGGEVSPPDWEELDIVALT